MNAGAVVTPAERRFVAMETAIGSLANGLMPALLIGLLSPEGPVPYAGAGGLIASLLPPTLGVGLTYPVILTLIVRMRQRKGAAPLPLWQRADHRWLRFVPDNLLLRGLAGMLAAFVVMIPLAIVSAWLLELDLLSRNGFILFNFVYGVGMGLLLTPAVVLAALTDRALAPAPARTANP